MNNRGATDYLFELEAESDIAVIEDRVDDMAMALLAGLCNNLAYALAGARGESRQRREMRELAAEFAAGIGVVLSVWQSANVEVVGGPCLDGLLADDSAYD